MMNRQTPEEEVEDLKAHIEMLKEELKAAGEDLNEL
jgi:archaellum component FlaC